MVRHSGITGHKDRPAFRSAAWAAHNAALQEKKQLLTGECTKPRIGALYSPKITTSPSVEIWRKTPPVKARVRVGRYFALFVFGLVVGLTLGVKAV